MVINAAKGSGKEEEKQEGGWKSRRGINDEATKQGWNQRINRSGVRSRYGEDK